MKLLSRERGSSLIETAVAMAMLMIGALSIWSAFAFGSRLNAESEDKTVAAHVAQLKMEEIRNTRYLSIVNEHPPGENLFENEPQDPPYWTLNSGGETIPSLPEGKYEISYPGLDLAAGIVPHPLIVKVTVSWASHIRTSSSLSLKTILSTTQG